MTFAAVGSPFFAQASTFSLTPNGVGNFIVVEVISQTGSEWATALSSSNVTWSVLVAAVTLPTGAQFSTVFIGKVTAASAATVTVSANSGTPSYKIQGMEFSTTKGYASVTLDPASPGITPGNASTTYPSVTPGFGAGELYYAYCYNEGTAVAGSTSGYTYNVDANGNGACWNPSCANSAQAPAWSDNSTRGGLAVMLYEAASSPASRLLMASYI